MIDCVGYIVPDALGAVENDRPRMVHTPWQEDPVPFIEAAEEGTRKVICDHSTIGMVVTTDGTIGEIPRASYEEAEARVVGELRALGKPFAVILNSAHPESPAASELGHALEARYGVPVALVNCLELDADDIREILSMVLDEFAVTEVSVKLPDWITALDPSHRIRASVEASVRECAAAAERAGDIVPGVFEAVRKRISRLGQDRQHRPRHRLRRGVGRGGGRTVLHGSRRIERV